MKITAQEEYGLRCLLRVARLDGRYAVSIQEIADAEKLSKPYAAKLLRLLRLSGLITSVQGKNVGPGKILAGYHLARPAAEIRLGKVLRALSEPLFEDPGYCERHASPDAGGPCVHSDGCTLRVIWQTLEQGVQRLLDGITLADLLQSPEQIAERLRARLHAESLEPTDGLLTLGLAARG